MDQVEVKAVCGAFLMIAFADSRFDRLEEGRFLGTVANDPMLAKLDTETLETCYNSLVAHFTKDYAGAAADVLAAVKSVKNAEDMVKAVKHASRLAIVADQKIMPQEEAALDSIALALGFEKGSV